MNPIYFQVLSSNFDQKYYSNSEHIPQNIESIVSTSYFYPKDFDTLNHYCPNLKSLDLIGGKNNTYDACSVLPFVNLESLAISLNSYNFIEEVETISQMTQLKHLTIGGADYCDSLLSRAIQPLKALKLLESLKFCSNVVSKNDGNLSLASMKEFRYLKNLKRLHFVEIYIAGEEIERLGRYLQKLEELHFEHCSCWIQHPEFSFNLMRSLKSFSYICNSEREDEHKNIADIILSLTSLEKLAIILRDPTENDQKELFEQALARHQSTLVELRISGPVQILNFQLLLKGLPNLRNLSLLSSKVPRRHNFNEHYLDVARIQQKIIHQIGLFRPQLLVFKLTNCKITSKVVQHIGVYMTKLEELQLPDQISTLELDNWLNPGVLYMGKLRKLKILRLSTSRINQKFVIRLMNTLQSLVQIKMTSQYGIKRNNKYFKESQLRNFKLIKRIQIIQD